ncbi:Actin-related protein 2/3 complex subunit 3 [Vitis vinifera]|uniref:Actin-related protein 2/3 complex subunit 3 n=1 Tax=Vitis vinifera TaxID=29760 RepID=A0A438J8B6_VITVI|nr:Actin-related protein 2/3 complex subunit 3 [Vitis vinifera]
MWFNPNSVHHSSFVDDEGITKACGCPLLPLKSHIKGPAPVSDQDRTDIVDEAITFFRANVFFRNFDIKSSADKLLIYLTFYINVALKRLEGCRTLAEGTKAIINLGLEKVPVPGESGFPFPGLFALPLSQPEAGIDDLGDALFRAEFFFLRPWSVSVNSGGGKIGGKVSLLVNQVEMASDFALHCTKV